MTEAEIRANERRKCVEEINSIKSKFPDRPEDEIWNEALCEAIGMIEPKEG